MLQTIKKLQFEEKLYIKLITLIKKKCIKDEFQVPI